MAVCQRRSPVRCAQMPFSRMPTALHAYGSAATSVRATTGMLFMLSVIDGRKKISAWLPVTIRKKIGDQQKVCG